MPCPTGDAAGRGGSGNDSEWTWAPELGVYHHNASGMYALPQGDGWRYLTSEELAAHTGTSGSKNDNYEPEEGEIEDDVGWGALMDPEKLARIESTKNPVYIASPQRRDPYGRETYSDGTPTAGDPLLAHEEGDDANHLLRLVVKRSQVLEVGSVAVLDARKDGTQLGRDRGAEARVRIKEMEVSKTHAVVFYQAPSAPRSPRRSSRSPSPYGSRSRSQTSTPAPPKEGDSGWYVSDLGSTLGTYVAHPGEADATRLSEPKCASPPYALKHGDKLTVGRTTFAVHIHQDWPCGSCQLSGNAQIDLEEGRLRPCPKSATIPEVSSFELDTFAMSGNGTRKGRQALKRRREMDALRDNLLGEDEPAPKIRAAAAGYVDRSAERRRLHPPSPPRRRDVEEARPVVAAGPTGPTGPSEAARKLLAKQGWSEGQGLGRTPGRADPIVPVVRAERAGLGIRGQVADQPGQGGDWRQRGRQRRWDEVSGK